MPRNFTRNQNELIDSIALSLEKLDSLLFFLENYQEEQHAISVRYPNLKYFHEPRVLPLLFMATEAQRKIKEDFQKLAFGEN